MQKNINFQEALKHGEVKEDDYFLVRYPNGRDKLFRLVKTEKGYVMWGPPTEQKVRFCGKDGYDKLFTLADEVVKKEYFLLEIFEDVYACKLSEKSYEVHSLGELRRILEDETKKHIHPDDKEMIYALASRCVYACSTYKNFYLFRVSNGNIAVNSLYRSDNDPWYFNYSVRPEAIPKATMCLNMEERDGSKERPWFCIDGQNYVQENEEVSESNDEIMRIIKEKCKTAKDVQEVIRKLEEYAKNLK